MGRVAGCKFEEERVVDRLASAVLSSLSPIEGTTSSSKLDVASPSEKT